MRMGDSKEVRPLYFHSTFIVNLGITTDLTTHAISDADLSQLKTQNDLATAWRSLVPAFPEDHIHVLPSIEHATNVIRALENDHKVDVLVTGSLHLVGGLIEVAGLSKVALQQN